jgi:hypothetical protein
MICLFLGVRGTKGNERYAFAARMELCPKEPSKNNLYIFAILPDAFVFAGLLHTFRYAPHRQFPKSPLDISRDLSSLFIYSS